MTVCAPAAANRNAMARPIPLDEPVTTAERPASCQGSDAMKITARPQFAESRGASGWL
jgi:hypothetical protein